MTEQRLLRLAAYILLVCAAVFLFLRFFLPVALPFGLGFALSQLAEPAVRSLRLRRGLSAALVMSALFLFCALVIILLARVCLEELTQLTQQLPMLLESLQEPLARLRSTLLNLAGRAPDGLGEALRDRVEKIFSDTSALIGQGSELLFSFLSHLVARLPAFFLFLVTTVVSSFMFSAEREALGKRFAAKIPAAWRKKGADLGAHLKQALLGWLRAEVRMMGITFAVVTAGLLLLGAKTPLLLGAAIAAVDALPVLGTGTVLIPWGIFSLLRGETVRGAGLLLLYGLAAALRTTLEPRLVGRQIGLHPLLTLLSMYAGFRFFGLGGMILLPILAILARQLWVYGSFGT